MTVPTRPPGRPDPTVAMLMGIPKTGKTGDAIYAYPQALFLAVPGALKIAKEVIGIDIPAQRIRNPASVRAAVDAIGTPPTGATAVVIDDLSLLVEATVRTYELGGVTRWTLWRTIRNDLMDLRMAARRQGLPVLFTLHDKEPRYDEAKTADNVMTRVMLDAGGPNLPGQMAKGMPAVCDMILHARKSESLVSLWPVVYENLPLNAKVEGVGLRELPPISPLPQNVGEILRLAGHLVPEPFAGHEETVEKLARVFISKPDEIKNLAAAAVIKLDAKFAAQGARAWVRRTWVLRDALARAQLRLALAEYRAKPRIYGSGGAASDEI